jgi:hypothetical protein
VKVEETAFEERLPGAGTGVGCHGDFKPARHTGADGARADRPEPAPLRFETSPLRRGPAHPLARSRKARNAACASGEHRAASKARLSAAIAATGADGARADRPEPAPLRFETSPLIFVHQPNACANAHERLDLVVLLARGADEVDPQGVGRDRLVKVEETAFEERVTETSSPRVTPGPTGLGPTGRSPLPSASRPPP